MQSAVPTAIALPAVYPILAIWLLPMVASPLLVAVRPPTALCELLMAVCPLLMRVVLPEAARPPSATWELYRDLEDRVLY